MAVHVAQVFTYRCELLDTRLRKEPSAAVSAAAAHQLADGALTREMAERIIEEAEQRAQQIVRAATERATTLEAQTRARIEAEERARRQAWQAEDMQRRTDQIIADAKRKAAEIESAALLQAAAELGLDLPAKVADNCQDATKPEDL